MTKYIINELNLKAIDLCASNNMRYIYKAKIIRDSRRILFEINPQRF